MPDVGGIAAERLKSYVMRIRNLEAEKKGIQEDVKEVYAEAKGTGFDTKVIRKVIQWMDAHEKNPADLQELEALFDLYKEALGLIPDSGTNRDIPLNPPKEKKGKGAEEPDPRQTDLEKHLGEDEQDDGADQGEQTPPPPAEPKPVTEAEARARGKADAEAGVPITGNPFEAGDPNRAAWELAWCEATGSDGMDLPHEMPKPSGKPAGKGKGGKGAKGGPKPPPPAEPNPDAPNGGADSPSGDDWQTFDDNFGNKKDE